MILILSILSLVGVFASLYFIDALHNTLTQLEVKVSKLEDRLSTLYPDGTKQS